MRTGIAPFTASSRKQRIPQRFSEVFARDSLRLKFVASNRAEIQRHASEREDVRLGNCR
jgi:hypothetical protein